VFELLYSNSASVLFALHVFHDFELGGNTQFFPIIPFFPVHPSPQILFPLLLSVPVLKSGKHSQSPPLDLSAVARVHDDVVYS